MFHCDYTSNTKFQFATECQDQCNSINLVGIYPQDKIEKALACNDLNSNEWVQFYIPEIVDIPTQKPDMEGIVSVSSCIEIMSQKVIKTPQVTGYTTATGTFIPGEDISNAECTNLTGRKLIIEGLIKQKIVYTALEPSQSLHSASFCIPFSVFIIIAKDTPLNQCFKLNSYIEDVFVCQLSERSVFKNTTIFIKATSIC
jgi:hypothetical protein